MARWSSLSLSESRRACSCPFGPQVPGHTGRVRWEKSSLATQEAQRAHVTCSTADWPRCHGRRKHASHRPRGSGQFQEGGRAIGPEPERRRGKRLLLQVLCGAGPLPPLSQPFMTSEGQQGGAGADAVKNQVLRLVLLSSQTTLSSCACTALAWLTAFYQASSDRGISLAFLENPFSNTHS